ARRIEAATAVLEAQGQLGPADGHEQVGPRLEPGAMAEDRPARRIADPHPGAVQAEAPVVAETVGAAPFQAVGLDARPVHQPWRRPGVEIDQVAVAGAEQGEPAWPGRIVVGGDVRLAVLRSEEHTSELQSREK